MSLQKQIDALNGTFSDIAHYYNVFCKPVQNVEVEQGIAVINEFIAVLQAHKIELERVK